MAKLHYNSEKWGWIPPYNRGYLEIENTTTDEGFNLKSFDDVAYYLSVWKFADDYVHFDNLRESMVSCATELGCIYRDVNELEHDIRKYYI